MKIIFVSLLTLTFTSCISLFDNKTNTFLKKQYNLRASDKAIVFIRGGDSTTDNSIHVFLTGYEHDLNDNDKGNIFTADTDFSKTVIDSTTVNVTWQSNDSLTVTYDKKLRIFEQKNKLDHFMINYVAK